MSADLEGRSAAARQPRRANPSATRESPGRCRAPARDHRRGRRKLGPTQSLGPGRGDCRQTHRRVPLGLFEPERQPGELPQCLQGAEVGLTGRARGTARAEVLLPRRLRQATSPTGSSISIHRRRRDWTSVARRCRRSRRASGHGARWACCGPPPTFGRTIACDWRSHRSPAIRTPGSW